MELADIVFRWLENPSHRAVTSTVTMTEMLVKPYEIDPKKLPGDIFTLLSVYPNVEWIAPDLEVARAAAELRARYRLKSVDALQIATAIRGQATCTIANDAAFRRITGLKVLLLDEYA